MARSVRDVVRPKLVLLVVAVLAGLGVYAYRNAAQSIFPAISLSRVEIFADAPDLPPERVRASVANPLETALQGLPDVRATRATATQGALEIEVDFASTSDVQHDLQLVDDAVQTVRPSLRGVRSVATLIENPNMEPVVSYAFDGGGVDQAHLQHEIERALVPVFTGTPGLGRMTVFGGAPLEYQVLLDARKLDRNRVSTAAVIAAIDAASGAGAAGTIDRKGKRYIVVSGPALDAPDDVARLTAPGRGGRRVPFAALGRTGIGEGPATQQASLDARHAVLFNAYPLAGADAVALQRAVEERMPRLLAALPHGVRVVRYWDQTRLIVASQRSLRDAILLGALLALGIIYLFLRSRAMTLIAALIVPLAMTLSVLAIYLAGLSLNLMTVGGLAVAVGLVIDEVIVVVEAIARRGAVREGTARIRRALIASTAANVVVFLPLALLGGISGFFFRALALTLSIAMLVSIVLSLFVAPTIAEMLPVRERHETRSLDALETRYARGLAWILKRSWIAYAGAAAVCFVTVFAFTRMPSDFLPSLEEGEFEIKYTLPAGTSLAATDATATALERAIVTTPDVAHVGRLTGVDTNGFLPTPPNAGTLRVSLAEGSRASFDEVSDALRDRLQKIAPDAEFEFHQLLEDQINDLTGAPEPVQLSVYGDDQKQLIAIATGLADKLGKIPGIVDTFDGVAYGADLVRTVNPVDPVDARLRMGGAIVASVPDGAAQLPVRVRVEGRAPRIAPGIVAHSSDVNEENGSRMLRVTAGIEGARLSDVTARVRALVAATQLPAGYRIELGGAAIEQSDSFREFATVICIAVLLVFGVLLATFDSFRLPLIVLATIPLSPIGVAAALWLTGTPLNVSSFMGLLLLVGIVVRNGILLIDGANRRRGQGASVDDALLGAARERLRPILMTTLAAMCGLAPLAFGWGSGSEMERPLAIAVIGGLSTATAFTLVLIPVLYAAVARRQTPRVRYETAQV
jgi:multidrug efflux pump subunit AcrB